MTSSEPKSTATAAAALSSMNDATTTTVATHSPPLAVPATTAAVTQNFAHVNTTPYGVSREQLEALSAMAYLVGSPLQRQQPCGGDATHPALLVAAKLLQQGVDPERIIQLVECRYEDSI